VPFTLAKQLAAARRGHQCRDSRKRTVAKCRGERQQRAYCRGWQRVDREDLTQAALIAFIRFYPGVDDNRQALNCALSAPRSRISNTRRFPDERRETIAAYVLGYSIDEFRGRYELPRPQAKSRFEWARTWVRSQLRHHIDIQE